MRRLILRAEGRVVFGRAHLHGRAVKGAAALGGRTVLRVSGERHGRPPT
jgi:hypothetical protein